MYPAIVTVSPTDDGKLVVRFDNGECRILDVTPMLSTGRFTELTDPEVFRRVRVIFDTIQWENGLDLDPEYVYERSEALVAESCVADKPRENGEVPP